MTPARVVLRKFPVDIYLLLLPVTVGVACLLPAEGSFAATANDLVGAVIALLFFLYGARLSGRAVVAGIRHWRLQAMVFLSTYVLFPLIGLALHAVLAGRIQPDIATGLLYLCVLPSTVQSSIAFTAIARGNVAAAICSASFSNLLGVFITPALVGILLPSTGGRFSVHALFDIGAQILLPFALGQLTRPWLEGWLSRHKRLVGVVDRGSILLVVYTAFSAGVVSGIWTKVPPRDLAIILGFSILVLAMIMTATTFGSRLFGFSIEDEISIVFCGSKKSLAAGVPMAAVLFPGHAVSLIVVPVMLFHQAQLFVCSVLARHYALRPIGKAD